MTKILWIDDEIDFLESHIIFLKERGYDIISTTNGSDALALLNTESNIDIVLLDEQMPGLDGLSVLNKIKHLKPSLPVVMITKSEDESLIDDALGGKISDYLIKPLHPKQLLSCIKKIVDKDTLESQKTNSKYLQQFNKINTDIMSCDSWEDWINLYFKLIQWDIDIKRVGDTTSKDILQNQLREANQLYADFVKNNYSKSLSDDVKTTPIFSHQFFDTYIAPILSQNVKVLWIVIDCMRIDQYLELESAVRPYFHTNMDMYLSILPTATPYSRNALFAGMLPRDIQTTYPHLWKSETHESKLNEYEEDLMTKYLEKSKIDVNFKLKKINTQEEARQLLSSVHNSIQNPLNIFIYNFIDHLIHTRSSSSVLRELSPDEGALRDITKVWLEHSHLIDLLRWVAENIPDCKVIVTSDHGSIRVQRDTKVLGDRNTTPNLRYKFGYNLSVENSKTITFKNFMENGLPKMGNANQCSLTHSDYYFVYPTQYNLYKEKYHETFLHGGVSMEEMILPVATLSPKKG